MSKNKINPKELTKNLLKKLKTKKGITGIIILVLSILIISIITWNILYVKVTFDTDGGNEIKSKYIRKGTQLKTEIIPQKFGYNFLLWTYGNTDNSYELNDYINNDITLLAKYEEKTETAYVEEIYDDIPKDVEITVHSLVNLTNKNISEHISITSLTNESIELDIKKEKNDLYTIKAKNNWLEGYTYNINILSLTQVQFISLGETKIGDNINKITFTIFKEDKYEYEYTDKVKEVNQNNVKSIDKKSSTEFQNTSLDTYSVKITNNKDYNVGDVLLLGTDNQDTSDDNYYVVIDNTGDSLIVREATLEDVYSELEFFYNNSVDFTKENADLDAIEQQLKDEIIKDEEGLVLLTNMYIKGAYHTKEVLNTLEGYSEEEIDDMMESSRIATIPTDKIDVKISNSITEDGETRVKLSVSVKGVEINLKDKGSITITFTITEEFTAYINVAIAKAENKGFYTYAGVNVNNDFTMSFSIELKTKDEIIDLAEEVENFLIGAAQSNDSEYEWINEINNSKIMETTFDYIPILEKQLFKTYIDVGLISIQVKIDGVISVGAEAALQASYKLSTYANAGKTNGYINSEGEAYTNEDGATKTWNNKGVRKSSFDFALKGAVGIRAGMKISINVSVLRMNDLYSIGLSLEAGVYFEFTGFVQVSIDITYSKAKTNLIGGIDLEIGLYIELDFIWNCWPLGMDTTDDYNIYNQQFPIYNFTSLGKVQGFSNTENISEENPVIVTTNKYNVFTDSPYLGLVSTVKYNETTKKYETITEKPQAYNISYYCVEYWDKTTGSVYCNPDSSINKYTSVIKTGTDAGTILISDEAPDGYKFFYRINGYIIDQITGERSETVTRDIWFQYEKPVDDGLYDITFDFGEGTVPEYPGKKEVKFTIPHGTELDFNFTPQSYTKDGITYVFDKWSNGFKNKMIFYNGDLTIKAIYKPEVAKYKFTFTASFGTFSNNKDTYEIEVNHNEKFNTFSNPTRLNYNFIGWTTDPLGDIPNVTIKDGYLYDSNNNKIYKNIELFAIWQEKENVPTYTLTFDAGDGWILDENGSLNHSASYTVKKGEEFWNIPIAIKSPNDALDYYYTDETFGLETGFIPTESKTYKANYTKMNREFNLFISDSTFIKRNGTITYSDDILAEVTENQWISGSFNSRLNLPEATITLDNQTYTTNKYIIIVENTQQVPYSMKNGANQLKSNYGWNYDTINVNFYGHNISSILYTPDSTINYGTLISYYHNGGSLDLRGISYVEATVVPYFEIS